MKKHNHEGEWVAVQGKKVVACGDDPGKLIYIVRSENKKVKTTFMRVP